MSKREDIISEFNRLVEMSKAELDGEKATRIAGIWAQRLKELFRTKSEEYELGLFVEIAEYGVVSAYKKTSLHRLALELYLEYSEVLADRNEHHPSKCLEETWAQDPVEPN